MKQGKEACVPIKRTSAEGLPSQGSKPRPLALTIELEFSSGARSLQPSSSLCLPVPEIKDLHTCFCSGGFEK